MTCMVIIYFFVYSCQILEEFNIEASLKDCSNYEDIL